MYRTILNHYGVNSSSDLMTSVSHFSVSHLVSYYSQFRTNRRLQRPQSPLQRLFFHPLRRGSLLVCWLLSVPRIASQQHASACSRKLAIPSRNPVFESPFSSWRIRARRVQFLLSMSLHVVQSDSGEGGWLSSLPLLSAASKRGGGVVASMWRRQSRWSSR